MSEDPIQDNNDLVPTEPFEDTDAVEQMAYEAAYRLGRTMWKNEELQHKATHDALTQLLNVEGLEQHLQRETVDNKVVLFADGTNIKAINDTLGHKRGDEAIVELANVLRSSLRKEDIIARIGGDEFVAIIDPTTREGEVNVAQTEKITRERIRQQTDLLLEKNPDLVAQGMDFAVGTTLGTKDMSLEEILNHAEESMMAEKNGQHEEKGKYR